MSSGGAEGRDTGRESHIINTAQDILSKLPK